MKIAVISKRKWRVGACAIALLAVVGLMFFCTGQTVSTVTYPKRKLPIYGVNTEEKKIALTFDCAWENSDTQILLDLLEQNAIKATFFTTGDWCERFPDDVKAFAAAGHDIENHSYNHPHVASISEDKLIEDTQKCDDIIESLTGVRPTLYRAPYGEYSDAMLTTFEETLGHKVIQWDVDSRDWQKREAAAMVETITDNVRPGSILLFHNDTVNTPAALRQIIPILKGQGYEFVLVKDLIYPDSFTLDNEGRQTTAQSGSK